jgi:polyhydroxyalkanoate synthesis regulator phasin
MPQYVLTKFGTMTTNQYKNLVTNHKKQVNKLKNELKAKETLYELHKAMTEGAHRTFQPNHGQYRHEISNLKQRLNALKNVLK